MSNQQTRDLADEAVRAFLKHAEEHPLDSMLRDQTHESVVKWTAAWVVGQMQAASSKFPSGAVDKVRLKNLSEQLQSLLIERPTLPPIWDLDDKNGVTRALYLAWLVLRDVTASVNNKTSSQSPSLVAPRTEMERNQYRKALEQIWDLPVESQKVQGEVLAKCKKIAHDALMVGNFLTETQGEVTLTADCESGKQRETFGECPTCKGAVKVYDKGRSYSPMEESELQAIEALQDRIAELEAQNRELRLTLERYEHETLTVKEVETERDRYRAALEKIEEQAEMHDNPFASQIAREALK